MFADLYCAANVGGYVVAISVWYDTAIGQWIAYDQLAGVTLGQFDRESQAQEFAKAEVARHT